ncbi:iron-sulfur cluster insertion protein ErpA [Roseospira marina]|uniref:Iron-sulfur cluster insertion protein ErpA n=1 Tax=Roseospira marina TaxID=140057 RepID=A0A5M6IBP9_9PROT|nr:iron-sulfur cluster insertion protein ErpA [Roseospira marina]KAA5605673.1 iron-sulfur cluster insertion protein ErpA [Roseospira marina]MBB4313248.1 iron-sulfur cluster insertion protein [Roseospira marina]MBB5086011.1 iron-sulfur cluster insertion protein [Roseospira marina]
MAPTTTEPDTLTAPPPPSAGGLTITEACAARVKTLIAAEGDPDLMLRVIVDGGGCSGFQYRFDLDKTTAEDDRLFAAHDVRVVIDEASLELLDGSVIDYVEDLMGAAFAIRNPNATATCGCGTSFSV